MATSRTLPDSSQHHALADVQPLEFITLAGERISVGVTTELADPKWDSFLESSSKGQFQQSSGWGRYKVAEGWSVMRVIYTSSSDTLKGGFQLLWKTTRRGKIAYVSKGPVLTDESWSTEVINHIKRLAVTNGFRAVIVQPPDECSSELETAVFGTGFLACSFLGIIDSTMLVDLSVGSEELSKHFRSSTRKKRNRSLRGGMQVRTGGEIDLSEFFQLMQMTCERQNEEPNPPSERSLRTLWASMNAERQRAHLKFTYCDEGTISGDLIIVFGERTTLFKTGWNGQHHMLHPNNLRVCETLEWAAGRGSSVADFVAFDRELATTLLDGRQLTPSLRKRRDAFKTGFGGTPKLLPPPGLWIPKPLLRFVVRQATKSSAVRNKLKGLVR